VETSKEAGRVRSAVREGAWEVEGIGYRTQAHLCLRRFEQKQALVRKRMKRLEAARRNGRTYRFPSMLMEEYRFYSSAAVVYSAMAVEGFLNYYGVKRLGEDFYRNNLERLSSDRKLAGVLAICTHQLLPQTAELVGTIRRLAERRNALVHPKAREPKSNGSRPSRRAILSEPSRDSVHDMERFFELFTQLDPDSVGAITW